jgi:arsenate reductase
MPTPKKILFVCVENAGRSQMAEGFFRKYCPPGYEPQSAGTVPAPSINQFAVEVMKEVGIDITSQTPKVIDDFMIRQAERVVNMGCMDKESCPALFIGSVVEWSIPDPKEKPIDEVRNIRDMIERKVLELCKTLE